MNEVRCKLLTERVNILTKLIPKVSPQLGSDEGRRDLKILEDELARVRKELDDQGQRIVNGDLLS
jgi:hypothetical protein